MTRRVLVATTICFFLFTMLVGAQDDGRASQIPKDIQKILSDHCLDCHGAEEPEAGIRLDSLSKLDLEEQLSLLNKVQDQVFFRLMPPADETELSNTEFANLNGWLSKQLGKHNASKLDEKLSRSEFGNYVNHNDLFSGEYAHLKSFTSDRRWLVSEYIFNSKINHLLDHEGIRTIDGVRTKVFGDNGVNLGTRFGGHNLRQSITNPFLLPDKIGVRDYSTTALTGGHLLTMISNAKKIAAYLSSEKAMNNNFPATYAAMKQEFEHQQMLSRRQKFLNDYIDHVCKEIYGDKHDRLLPQFQRVQVEEITELLDAKGNPRPKENNMELLRGRYDAQDIQAIYRGIQEYKRDDVSYEHVIQLCERNWFNFGINQKRIKGRVSLMRIMNVRWDMKLIYQDVKKQNMALPKYKRLPDSEMTIIENSIRKHRKQDDRLQQVILKCVKQWNDEFRAKRNASNGANQGQNSATGPDPNRLRTIVRELFLKILERNPSQSETTDYVSLATKLENTLSRQETIAKLIESLVLSSELVYRNEFGTGASDAHGRRMMSPRDASFALSYALTDQSPDEELAKAASNGQLRTREDYRRQIIRMLKKRDQYYVIDETVQKAGFNASITNIPIRKLRFFREFFGYPKAATVFKDDARFGAGRYDGIVGRLIDEADLLVAHILDNDKDVFEELLSTEKFYVYHSGDNAAMKAASDRLRTIYEYFSKHDWKNFTEEQLYEHWPFIKKMKMRGTVFPDFETNERRRSGWVRSFKTHMTSLEERLGKGQKAAIPYDAIPMAYWHKGNATGRTGQVMRAHEVTTFFNIDYRDWDYPTNQPAPVSNRKGLLTHPAWLIAHSLNLETDPVRRGKWIREKLLAGTIPDVPITVDAVIPEDQHKTLRQRLQKKTSDAYCWNCHQKMDPLGLPFESYDDFGRFRKEERLEHAENLVTAQKQAPRVDGIQLPIYKTLPVETGGELTGTDNASLDGKVSDAFELIDRLTRSRKVRQSIIRHAFRFFLGRNETLTDSKTLIDAEKAYVESGGSFDAVIISLLTSDSFIYRKSNTNKSNIKKSSSANPRISDAK